MYQPVNMDNGFAVAVPAPGDYVPISILSEMLDKRFNQQKIDFGNALADCETRMEMRMDMRMQTALAETEVRIEMRMQTALAETEVRIQTALAETEVRIEMRMQSALAETEGRLCKAISEVDKRLSARIDKLEESGRKTVTALTDLTAKIELLERAHAILIQQVQTGMLFNPIHDLGNVSLAGLPGNAQEYLEHQRQETVALHSAVQEITQQLLSLPVKIRTEVEKAFGEHKQVMEFRIKKLDDRLAALIETGNKFG